MKTYFLRPSKEGVGLGDIRILGSQSLPWDKGVQTDHSGEETSSPLKGPFPVHPGSCHGTQT